MANSGDGNDIIQITGGNGHTVHLGEGTNDITVSAENVTLIQKSTNAIDDITVQWSDNIGVLRINTINNTSGLYEDYLTITGAKSTDFTFEGTYLRGRSYTGQGLSLISETDPGCGIEIGNWKKNQVFSGITFDDKTLSFASINQKAGLA